tara:strand:- start:524 stop:865 length:342 start_codon:yes stop_codon:yes gene_type:complete
MTVKEVIDIYRSSQTLPRKCHLNWLKENFNPILYDIDKSLNINWGCQTCSRNYLSMISRYLDEQAIIKAEQDEAAERAAMQDMINEQERKKNAEKVAKNGRSKAKNIKKTVKS